MNTSYFLQRREFSTGSGSQPLSLEFSQSTLKARVVVLISTSNPTWDKLHALKLVFIDNFLV